MLGLRDNLTLSLTKLRTRRVRLMVTLVVSGLLFAVLVAGSLFIRGVLGSLNDFTKDGFASRFLVAVYSSAFQDMGDPVVVKRAQAIDKATRAQKTAEAKRLGVPYDPNSEPEAAIGSGDGNQINPQSPAAQQALRELHPLADISAELKQVGAPYGLTATYSGAPLLSYTSGTSAQLSPIVQGQETDTSQANGGSQDPIVGFGFMNQTMDNSLLEPFLLQGATLATKPGEPVPIMAPVDAVEKLVGLKPLSPKATAKDKLARLKEIRAKAKNLVFGVCYRNGTAVDLYQQVKSQAAAAAANQGKAGYVAPSVQYGYGAAPCSPVVITKDTRTAEERDQDRRLDQFRQEFGAEAPRTTLVNFRIVGVLPKLDYGAAAFDVSAIVSSFLTSTLGSGWYVSSQAAQANPVLGPLLRSQAQSGGGMLLYIAEFHDRAGQKRFMQERTCQNNSASAPGEDPMAPCKAAHQYFMTPYGNPLAALYDVGPQFQRGLRWALLVLAALAAIVMMGTVGKIIADSRKETSVFRAVGAKRLDITQIYLLYAAMLASLAFALALAFGLAVAMLGEAKYSGTVSVQAVLAFNSPNADKPFHLIGLNVLDLGGIYLFAVLTGLLSALLPLATNVRRNPIKDMREE